MIYVDTSVIGTLTHQIVYSGSYMKAEDGHIDDANQDLFTFAVVANAQDKDSVKFGMLDLFQNYEEMLYMFLHDFGCSVQGASKVEMLTKLNDFLIESYAQNRNPVLIIDEAQNLSSEVLEELRMLSNLETDSQKLIQIVHLR